MSGAAGSLGKSADEWRRILGAARYEILFGEGTEPPWSSPLNALKEPGTFVCAGCHAPLFDAAAKFDSGTGWPSFFRPIDAQCLATRPDLKLGMLRTEHRCARCGGHQGHVFEDGPPPTGLRYCNNGGALLFIPAGQALPPLRG